MFPCHGPLPVGHDSNLGRQEGRFKGVVCLTLALGAPRRFRRKTGQTVALASDNGASRSLLRLKKNGRALCWRRVRPLSIRRIGRCGNVTQTHVKGPTSTLPDRDLSEVAAPVIAERNLPPGKAGGNRYFCNTLRRTSPVSQCSFDSGSPRTSLTPDHPPNGGCNHGYREAYRIRRW